MPYVLIRIKDQAGMPSQNAYLVDQNKNQSLIKSFQTDVFNWNDFDDLVKLMISTFVARNQVIANLRMERELTFHFSATVVGVVDPLDPLHRTHLDVQRLTNLKTAAATYRDLTRALVSPQNDRLLDLVLQVFNQHFKLVRASDDDVNITAPCWNEVHWRIERIVKGDGPGNFQGDFPQRFRVNETLVVIRVVSDNHQVLGQREHRISIGLPFYTPQRLRDEQQEFPPLTKLFITYKGFLRWQTYAIEGGIGLLTNTTPPPPP